MKKYNFQTGASSLARLPGRLTRSLKKRLAKRIFTGTYHGVRYEVMILQHQKILELESQILTLKSQLKQKEK